MDPWQIASVGLGAVNLGLILKIILNDLGHVRSLLVEHLRDHATGEFEGVPGPPGRPGPQGPRGQSGKDA